ncbi:GntR family transcriptional regulator [Paenibacillus phoenicis]|uniref:GntR family transcriptional regulator n=1 Tax=Paenibacillus phoenicis TaxID=554117 RepID=A0ABU5PR30_9BACL|nr:MULTISPECIES: GntR family transcriptional regulator [Paenibacillus]EES74295.1 transcriptional regulator, GntR family [Paenibacillus sp. oral taxon 786 str. D14]MCT2196783.1 GntR family transcriptional regulator [Paenibacillus sp. p3-SID1389]MEA3572386.1 GntR family transcriptional regulator [Paenibacillus phoenicis]
MWIPIQINENSAAPLYHQIESQLRSLIVSGQIEEGTLLPSIREFAGALNCSVITVRRVYQDLEAEGLLRTRQGTGTFVAKVSADERDEYRTAVVKEALEKAVDTGKSMQYEAEELKQLFLQVMQQKYNSNQDKEGAD